jgi:hypothetical protein
VPSPFPPGDPIPRPGATAPPADPIELAPRPDGAYEQPAPARPRYGLALLLFALTLFCTTTLGAFWSLAIRTDAMTDLAPYGIPLLLPQVVAEVWSDPQLLATGLSFSLPALFILLCHELGHYLTCRRYGLPATLPYFLPVPGFIGTFGAFIRIKAPIREKKQLFDVGIAGPLAGFVALLPVLFWGVAHSVPAPIPEPPSGRLAASLLVPGNSLAIKLATLVTLGPLPDGWMLNLHPAALAAWLGLLATALNLLPLGQLDGGHIVYAVFGRWQRQLALPLWVGLGLLGLYWPGWLLWCLIVLVLGLKHPPVADEHRPLDRRRKLLAAVALAIMVLSFIPVPLAEIPVELEIPYPAPAEEPASQRLIAEAGGRSRTKVTGPSLTSSTSMWAPKTPFCTSNPAPASAWAKASTSGSA